jgi:hypothetical protein
VKLVGSLIISESRNLIIEKTRGIDSEKSIEESGFRIQKKNGDGPFLLTPDF